MENIQGVITNFNFNKSDFEFDARLRENVLGVNTLSLAGQNAAQDFIIDFSQSKNGIFAIKE